jgi:cobalamin synthase
MTRSGLFLSSYAPLFLILAVRFTQGWLVILCLALAIVGVGMAVWILDTHRRSASGAIGVKKVDDVGEQATAYIVTYLLPFVAVKEPSLREVLAYAILFLVAGLVYVRSDMQQINPTLYLLQRRILKVTTDHDRTLYVITRHRLLPIR